MILLLDTDAVKMGLAIPAATSFVMAVFCFLRPTRLHAFGWIFYGVLLSALAFGWQLPQ